ncbi:nucleotidyltransferase family protein [Thermodesulfobacteriota bacterium]
MKRYPSIYKFLKTISVITLDRDSIDYIRYYIKKGGPWHYIYQKAESERVSGLLFYHLERLDLLNNLPVSFRKKLTNAYNTTLKDNLNYMACLLNIEEILRINDINAIALQGLSVLKLYGDPGLRSMSDMDILIKPENREIILNSLKQIGFSTASPDKPELLVKNNILLDVHIHPLNIDRIRTRKNIFPEDITGFWERASSFSDSGSQILLSMDMYDSFLCLSAHALKHCYGKLILLCDLKELLHVIAGNEEGWSALIRRAENYGQEKVLLYSLMMLEQVYGVNVPFKVKYVLDSNRINVIEKRIIRLISEGTRFETVSVILWLFSIKGVMNKIRFLKEIIFPRKEVMASMVRKKHLKIKISDYLKRLLYVLRTIGRDLSRILFF